MSAQDDPYIKAREFMVRAQVAARGVHDHRVLNALLKVPRHLFVSEALQHRAYEDLTLPIGCNQTISQPYIVGFMSEAAKLQPTDKVLEIGTGCGYQAAVLSYLCQKVYTIEILEPLAKQAQKVIQKLGYSTLHMRIGDGYEGWPEAAPFDAIIATAAPEQVPQTLLNQLKIGGRLIMPVGHFPDQHLLRITKTEAVIEEEYLLPVRFVPMTGKVQEDNTKSYHKNK